WQRLDIPVRSEGSQSLQQLIGNVQSAGCSIVVSADDQITRQTVIRQIVGKCSYCLGEFVDIVDGCGAFDPVTLAFVEQADQFFLLNHRRSTYSLTTHSLVTRSGICPLRPTPLPIYRTIYHE